MPLNFDKPKPQTPLKSSKWNLSYKRYRFNNETFVISLKEYDLKLCGTNSFFFGSYQSVTSVLFLKSPFFFVCWDFTHISSDLLSKFEWPRDVSLIYHQRIATDSKIKVLRYPIFHLCQQSCWMNLQ